VQVRARGPSRRSHRPQRLTALDALALIDHRRVEVEIGRVEPETVVEDDEPSRKEELGDPLGAEKSLPECGERGWPLMIRRAPNPLPVPVVPTGGVNLPCHIRSGVMVR